MPLLKEVLFLVLHSYLASGFFMNGYSLLFGGAQPPQTHRATQYLLSSYPAIAPEMYVDMHSRPRRKSPSGQLGARTLDGVPIYESPSGYAFNSGNSGGYETHLGTYAKQYGKGYRKGHGSHAKDHGGGYGKDHGGYGGGYGGGHGGGYGKDHGGHGGGYGKDHGGHGGGYGKGHGGGHGGGHGKGHGGGHGGGYGKGHGGGHDHGGHGGGGYGGGNDHGGGHGGGHDHGGGYGKGPSLHFKPAPYKGPYYGPYDLIAPDKGKFGKKKKFGDDPVKESAKKGYEKPKGDPPIKHFGGFGGGGSSKAHGHPPKGYGHDDGGHGHDHGGGYRHESHGGGHGRGNAANLKDIDGGYKLLNEHASSKEHLYTVQYFESQEKNRGSSQVPSYASSEAVSPIQPSLLNDAMLYISQEDSSKGSSVEKEKSNTYFVSDPQVGIKDMLDSDPYPKKSNEEVKDLESEVQSSPLVSLPRSPVPQYSPRSSKLFPVMGSAEAPESFKNIFAIF